MKALLLLLAAALVLHTCMQILPTQDEIAAIPRPTAVDVGALVPVAINTTAGSGSTPVASALPALPAGIITVAFPVVGGKDAGAAFFIGPTTAITAFHVVQDSLSLATLDKPQMRITYTDPMIDTAVLSGPSSSSPIYKLSTDLPTVGERLMVQCLYPYTDRIAPVDVMVVKVPTFFQEDNEASSQVVIGSIQMQELSGSVQPGCSGSPVTDSTGAVVGMLIAGTGGNVQAVASKTILNWMAGQ